MAVPFISQADLEDYLEYVTVADKSKIALDAACDEIRVFSGQSLDYVASDTVSLDSDGTDTLLLPEMPVYSVASVVGPGGPLTLGTNYVLDKEMGALRTKSLGLSFLKGRQIYSVTYSHGYVSTVTAGLQIWPSSLRLVALQLAARIYSQGLASSESVGGISMSYSAPESGALTDRERDIIEKAVGVGRRR